MPLPAFTDESVAIVEFKSSWKLDDARKTSNISVQTKEIETQNRSCQSVNRDDQEVQTESSDKTFQLVSESNKEKLLAFLKKVEPFISKVLIRNVQSTAFEGFGLSSESDSSQCSVLHTLNPTEINHKVPVTAVSWNSTGSVIAASYGRFDHDDWCTHKTSLSVWSLHKIGPSSNKPDSVIDLSSCLMSIAFHPVEPAVLAGGTFNGEIMVWDMSRETDILIASSGKGNESHNEPVSKVMWLQSADRYNVFHVVSVGFDGKMLIWKLVKDKERLVADSGYLLLASNMPKSIKVKTSKKNAEMGVTSLAFSEIDNTVFYVGSESGGLFKCSTNYKSTPIADDNVSIQLYDPVTFKFQPHKGPVYSISANPFHRNVLASCSSDTTIRIFSALQPEPVAVFEPASGYLYNVRWSPARPLVCAASTHYGQLLVFDLRRSSSSPTYKLDVNSTKEPVYSLEFNNKQKNLLATGDASGTVKVWRLNEELTLETLSERDQLNSLVDELVDE